VEEFRTKRRYQAGVSRERTFRDESDLRAIRERFVHVAGKLAGDVGPERRACRGRTLSIKLKTSDFRSFSRSESRTLPFARDAESLFDVAWRLAREELEAHAKAAGRPVPLRLIGIALSNLVFDDGFDPRAEDNLAPGQTKLDALFRKAGGSNDTNKNSDNTGNNTIKNSNNTNTINSSKNSNNTNTINSINSINSININNNNNQVTDNINTVAAEVNSPRRLSDDGPRWTSDDDDANHSNSSNSNSSSSSSSSNNSTTATTSSKHRVGSSGFNDHGFGKPVTAASRNHAAETQSRSNLAAAAPAAPLAAPLAAATQDPPQLSSEETDCPVCGQSIKVRFIENHVNRCIDRPAGSKHQSNLSTPSTSSAGGPSSTGNAPRSPGKRGVGNKRTQAPPFRGAMESFVIKRVRKSTQ
jgi:hypothetical protein